MRLRHRHAGRARRQVRGQVFGRAGQQHNNGTPSPQGQGIEAADAGAQAGVGKENRQEKYRHELADVRTPGFHKTGLIVQQYPQHEAAKYRENAQLVREHGADENQTKNHAQQVIAPTVLAAQPLNQPAQQGAHQPPAHNYIHRQPQQRQAKLPRAELRRRQHGHQRQQKPAHHIIDGGRTDGNHAQRLASNIKFDQHAPQNGQGRDGKSRAHKQRRRCAAGARRKHRCKAVAQCIARGKRHHHAGHRDAHHAFAVLARLEVRKLELHADLEHQQNQTKLREDVHGITRDRVKHILKRARKQPAKQGRPQHNAHDDFAHGRRLPPAYRQKRANTPGHNDHRQLQQDEKQQQLGLMHAGKCVGFCSHQYMPPLTEMV